MPDEFEQVRSAMIRNAEANGKASNEWKDAHQMILENQRVICATLAVLVRGGHAPIEMARDLQDRAKKITKLLEG